MSSHPIYVAPDDARWEPISQIQFNKLEQSIKARKDVDKYIFGPTAGSFSLQGVDFTYTYDAANAVLQVHIVAVHSLKAKLVGHQAIFDALNDGVQGAIA